MPRGKPLLLMVLAAALGGTAVMAQSEWTALARARARRQLAHEEQRRVEALAREGLVSEAELGKAKAAAALADLDYAEALWALQGSRLHVLVVDSIRHSSADALDAISLELALPPPGGRGEEELEVARSFGVADLKVSLLHEGVVVGYPYATVVPFLAAGERAQLHFRLLRAVDAPTVQLEYQNRVEQVTLVPRAQSSPRPFRVLALQPALAATFGEEARFVVRVEPLVADELTLALETRGLPEACRTRYVDTATGAGISSLRMEAGSRARDIELLVTIPAGEAPGVVPDIPIAFHLVLQGQGRAGQEVEVPLQLTPVGSPRLEVRAPTWLAEGVAGKTVALPLEVINTGTAPALGVTVVAEVPAPLRGFVGDPVERLAVGQKAAFQVLVEIGGEALPGEYALELYPRAQNQPRGRREGVSHFRVRVVRETALGVWGALAIAAAVAAVAGVAWLFRQRLD